jgi:hypothetical protein
MTKFKSLFLLLLNVVFYSVNAQKGPENQPTNLQFFQLKPWEVNLSFQQT